MTAKIDVVEQIGECGLVVPELINLGLAANDRLKYYLTLLQAAKAHGQQPYDLVSNLHAEREASGVDDAALDEVVPASHLQPDGSLQVPGLRHIQDLVFRDVRQMMRPLLTQDVDSVTRTRAAAYERRLDALAAQVSSWHDDCVAPSAIDRLTRTAEGAQDGVHQLVMDLHHELNQLQASVASESIDGARAYGLSDEDRALVQAFMNGVNETAALKFDHPGLGTTATRIGGRLSIQNDLGTTDAHVIVINVSGLAATLVYTDVHRRRAQFFRDLLTPGGVSFQAGPPPAGASYEMSVGQFATVDREALERWLTFVGSRLVFLIDWNKARKRLGRFMKKSEAVVVLRWAADNNIGHRAFLQAGDTRLVYTALERAARAQLRYGARLDELLGRDRARTFLTSVLRIAADGLRAGKSPRLIQDEVEAELLTHLSTTERSTLAMAAEHAMLVSGLAERLRHALVRVQASPAPREVARTAALAKAWETRADELVSRACRLRDQSAATRMLTDLLTEADEVADALEETAFTLTMLPEDVDRNGIAVLAAMADLINRSAKEYVRCLEGAKDLPREPSRADVEDVLVAVDRIAELEHESDTADRAATARVLEASGNFRELYVLAAIAGGFEQAADALARCGRIVRDYVLTGVSVAS